MIRKTLSVYWMAMKPRKWLWLIAFLSHTAFFVGVSILQPLLIARFIGDLANLDGKTYGHFVNFVWLWVGLHAGQTIVGRIGIHTYFRSISNTLMDLDLMSFRTLLSHSSDFFSNSFTGSLVTKFNRFTRSFDVLSTAAMFDMNAILVQITVPFFILLFIAPPIAFIFLLWTMIFTVSLFFLHRKKLPRARKVAEYDSRVTGSIADVVTNVLSIKMFSQFTQEYASFKKLSRERVKARLHNMFFGDVIRVYKVVFIILLEVPVFLLSASYALAGTVEIAQLLLIQLYITKLIDSLWNFGKLVEKLEEALADATEMAEIYALEPSVQDISSPKKLSNVKGEIVLEKVNFTYKGENESTVFRNLDLTIPIGQKVGLVGPSGGGKTTLTKLLLRFMDVSSGRILLDGQDISEVTQDELRRNIAYVPQEPLLFHRSIYENIAYGDPSASKSQVLEAARLAHADEFIEKLPQGYDTMVGERGVKLSGGQKQRVAIARAMLKKAPILLLDEATSALDSKSEKLITGALDTLMKNRTTIVIAHRLSTIRKLQRVIVVDDGKIVEDGSHTELLERKGLYAELWGHQQGDFLED